ncbi:MAG: orotidine-5'-phosphate decarboxylase [Gammaproteobacteria bacterium]|nr:orotidine-5'-phosphate decarboxylase [Gammaproteobacteria bacterium]
MKGFYKKLAVSWKNQNSLLCIGLDPDLERLPETIRKGKAPLFEFNREIIDATALWACAFKPQIAYYAAIGAEAQLEKTIEYIHTHYPLLPVVLDAKRGDIGSTARKYAQEAFQRYQADAVTVNPYMGGDTLQPFFEHEDKGVFILCRTSNPGSGDFQEMKSGQHFLYEQVAQRAMKWNVRNNIGLVAGATFPEVIGRIREIVGDMPLLIPGIGKQGGDIREVLRNGLNADKTGLVINVSRAILYSGGGRDFAAVAGDRAREICLGIREHAGRPESV